MRQRPPPRTLEVLGKQQLTPNMLRVTLGGPGLAGFPPDAAGGYVKFRLGESPMDSDKSLIRTYTVRHVHDDPHSIDVDFVAHESDGPAVNWALDANIGDPILVGGPGPAKPLDRAADWFLIAGDMSALPAILVNLENLDANARGHAFLEIIDEDDRQDVRVPDGLRIEWIVNPDPETPNQRLADAVRSLVWPGGEPYAWVAGEFSQSLEIRRFLKAERNLDRSRMYASSYWQIGQTEDGHRVSKSNATDD